GGGVRAGRYACGQAGEARILTGPSQPAGGGCRAPPGSPVVAAFGAPAAPEPQSASEKQRTLEALIRQLEGLARQRPVVMVFEDAHWIDPTSRELLDLTVERVRSLPVLLIVTF